MNQKALADVLNVSLSKVSRAESGETKSGDILLTIQEGLEKNGVRFTPNGVELSENYLEIIEGEGCYLKLLDDVYFTLKDSNDKTLYIMFASDKVSPPAVNDRYKFMRRNGILMRQLIRDDDEYIIGPLDEYRGIPKKYFTNIVTLIYGNKVAQANGDETRIAVQNDNRLADREKGVFCYFWDTGVQPVRSISKDRF